MRTVGSYALRGRHHGRSTLYLPGLGKEAPSAHCGSRQRRRLRLDHTRGRPRGCGERAALPGPACRARRRIPAHHPRTLRLRLAEKPELLRTHLLRTRVNKARSGYSWWPNCVKAALLPSCSGSGRSHKEAWAGWTVLLTTPITSFLSTSTSVSFRNRAEKAARVFAASYLRR